MIRILIVDDHSVVRKGLRAILENHYELEVVAETGSGREAIDLASRLRPELILLDLHLPDLDGRQVLVELKRRDLSTRVLVLSAFALEADALGVLSAGALGYLLKSASPEEILDAVRRVASGLRVITPSVSDLAAEALGDAPLTDRERQILQNLALGRSNDEMAKALGITRRTVKEHMTHLLAKLSARDRTQAVLTALRRGLIQLS